MNVAAGKPLEIKSLLLRIEALGLGIEALGLGIEALGLGIESLSKDWPKIRVWYKSKASTNTNRS